MEEYTVALTPQAEQQLRAIVHHIAHELLEPETADALLTALEQAMASLSLLPQRAPPCRRGTLAFTKHPETSVPKFSDLLLAGFRLAPGPGPCRHLWTA